VLGSRQEGPDRWFSTSESAHPAPWVELHLPHNVRLLSLQHYTFTHGHHRSSYFRWAPQKRKEKTTPFGINLVRSQVSHWAAQ